jgi:PIN domain
MQQKNPDFHVVLDSNTVWAGGARDFLNRKVSGFIQHPPKAHDVKIHWYLPYMVKEERRYQMEAEAQALLGPLGKANELLGLGLKVNLDTLNSAVRQIVDASMADHEFIEKQLNPEKVDWSAVMLSAVRRTPPFEHGDTEKGFRDAIVLEVFLQVAEEAIGKDPKCSVFLISNDALLGKAAIDRIKSHDLQHATVVENIDKLRSIVNAVPAHLSLAEINKLLVTAAIDFYDQKNQSGLYFSERIESKISRDFASVLNQKFGGL